ncbi:magnesium transporter CorA family protein [Enterococcus rivorum]|uniref:Cation transporter n=1 Tax=Enterococcus rivorum TaxID=762845 RepID=A0A1E5KYV8_9ENTE|nr:CorA family divalent cation transporter [Enterococcus rivorum]MBP2097596.1 magnesium transporter [Enterococcus rivorum]OEH83045.1 cation transporter [Enterococcus rivorum]
MKFYHIKSEEDILEVTEDERFFVICDRHNFSTIYKQFNIINQEESRKAVDLVHFESHADYDVISFSFFEWKDKQMVFEKVYLYFSRSYVIFVCDQNETLFKSVTSDIQLNQDKQPNGIDTLTYIYFKMLDHILSEMFVSLEHFETSIAEEEMSLLKTTKDYDFEKIIQMKAISFEAKRQLRLLTYISEQILSNDNNLIEEENLKYFKNISAKTNRLYEFGSSLNDKTAHLMDLYNTNVSERSNNFLNKLTVFTAFATPITVLSGIYGMNFVNIPELKLKYGYFFLLGLIGCITGIIYVLLKKSKML